MKFLSVILLLSAGSAIAAPIASGSVVDRSQEDGLTPDYRREAITPDYRREAITPDYKREAITPDYKREAITPDYKRDGTGSL